MGNTSLKHVVDTPLATTHSLNFEGIECECECTIMLVNDCYMYTITEENKHLVHDRTSIQKH